MTVLSGVVANTAKNWTLWERMQTPEDISVHGHLIDWLFNYTTYMNLFFFFLVCAGLFGFSYFYSAKRNKNALYTHGTKKIHIIVASVVALSVFLGIDMNITRLSNDDYVEVFANWPTEEENPLRIQVMAQQWAWNFRYAGRDGVFNTEDDVVQLNDLRLPVGRKILFQVVSKDVIHSLFFPNTRRKVDAIPGRITRMWFELTKDGYYNIACAEMCGTYHYRMKAYLTSYNQNNFAEWMKEAEDKAIAQNDRENADLYWGWPWTW